MMKMKRLISILLVLALLPACCLAASDEDELPIFLDSETVLVGDSLTCHLIAMLLRPYDLLCGASYMAAPNSAVNYYFEDWWPLEPLEQNAYGSETSEGLEGLTFAEAVEATAGQFTRVLFLMGSNSSEYSVVEDFTVVIDHMLLYWPDATIYMETVPDSSTGVVATERINGIIREAVEHYEAQEETRVKLLDTNSCWGSGCYLPDGAHLTELGLRTWYKYLAENLPIRRYLHEMAPAMPLEEFRRLRQEQRAKYFAKYWFIQVPLER